LEQRLAQQIDAEIARQEARNGIVAGGLAAQMHAADAVDSILYLPKAEAKALALLRHVGPVASAFSGCLAAGREQRAALVALDMLLIEYAGVGVSKGSSTYQSATLESSDVGARVMPASPPSSPDSIRAAVMRAPRWFVRFLHDAELLLEASSDEDGEERIEGGGLQKKTRAGIALAAAVSIGSTIGTPRDPEAVLLHAAEAQGGFDDQYAVDGVNGNLTAVGLLEDFCFALAEVAELAFAGVTVAVARGIDAVGGEEEEERGRKEEDMRPSETVRLLLVDHIIPLVGKIYDLSRRDTDLGDGGEDDAEEEEEEEEGRPPLGVSSPPSAAALVAVPSSVSPVATPAPLLARSTSRAQHSVETASSALVSRNDRRMEESIVERITVDSVESSPDAAGVRVVHHHHHHHHHHGGDGASVAAGSVAGSDRVGRFLHPTIESVGGSDDGANAGVSTSAPAPGIGTSRRRERETMRRTPATMPMRPLSSLPSLPRRSGAAYDARGEKHSVGVEVVAALRSSRSRSTAMDTENDAAAAAAAAPASAPVVLAVPEGATATMRRKHGSSPWFATLLRTFQYYCAYGERSNVGTKAGLTGTKFAKFAREAKLVETMHGSSVNGATSPANSVSSAWSSISLQLPLEQEALGENLLRSAEVDLIFKQVARERGIARGRRIDFDGFEHALNLGA